MAIPEVLRLYLSSKDSSISALKIRLAENVKVLTHQVNVVGHNPKGTFLKKINQNISELKAQIIKLEKKNEMLN